MSITLDSILLVLFLTLPISFSISKIFCIISLGRSFEYKLTHIFKKSSPLKPTDTVLYTEEIDSIIAILR